MKSKKRYIPHLYTCGKVPKAFLQTLLSPQYLEESPIMSSCLTAPLWLEQVCEASLSHRASRSCSQTRMKQVFINDLLYSSNKGHTVAIVSM